MKELVKKFYIKKYPSDELGLEIRDHITFEDVYNKIKEGGGEEIYDFIGVWDSLVRERIFGELSDRLGVDYDTIYDLWAGYTKESYKESFEYLSDEDQKKEAKEILSKYVSFDEVKNGEEDLSYVKDQLIELMTEGHIEADAYKYIIDNFDELKREFLVTEDVEIEKEEGLRSLTDFINDGDFHTIVTDDARTFNVHEWEKRVEADDDSGSDTLDEDVVSTEHFVVSKEDVQAVLDKIATSNIFVADYYKTKGFMKSKGLTAEDIKEIAKQLEMGDYSYSMNSNSFKTGDVISVFITDKDFKVKDVDLSNCVLYIEIDTDYGDPVAIVSMHNQYKGGRGPEKNPYREEESMNEEFPIEDDYFKAEEHLDSEAEYDADHETKRGMEELINDLLDMGFNIKKGWFDDLYDYYTKRYEYHHKEIYESMNESKKITEELHEGDYFEYGDLSFELLYLDSDEDAGEFAIICHQIEDAVADEDVIGYVDRYDKKEDVMKVIKDNYDTFYSNVQNLDNYKSMNESVKVNEETDNKAILSILGVTDNETLTQEDKDSYIRQFHELEKKGYDPASIWLKSDYGTYINTKILDETEDLVTVEYPTSEAVKEGISGKMTPEEIAKKHNVSIEEINKQLEKGIKVEKEHTDDEKEAERIALDHLFEIPDYYDRLDKMEKRAKVTESFEDDYNNVFVEFIDGKPTFAYERLEDAVRGVRMDKYGEMNYDEKSEKPLRKYTIMKLVDGKYYKIDGWDSVEESMEKGALKKDTVKTKSRFVPTQRTAIDGKTWWVVYDNKEKKYTTIIPIGGKYKTKKDCQYAIDSFIEKYPKYDNLNEDTIKTSSGKWTNKGKEGTHGTFKTKKEADAQRRAIWVNWKK